MKKLTELDPKFPNLVSWIYYSKGEFLFCAIDIISLFEGYNSLANNVLNEICAET